MLQDFAELWPEKLSNKTNGVTPRRWVALANPRLAALITETIGDGWLTQPRAAARARSRSSDDSNFRMRWREIKRCNKRDFAQFARERTGILLDPDSMFDVQVKRIHEYKRQHLAILHVAALYHRLKSDPHFDMQPRTFIFGGKAAPGYHYAKLMIKLINSIGEVVNRDPQVRDRLKVLFLPNFNVTNGQRLYPAAELSEQISTAGKEASGTGNMKFCMNGALDDRHVRRREHRDLRGKWAPRTSSCSACWRRRCTRSRRAATVRPTTTRRTPELRAAIDLIARRLLLARRREPVPPDRRRAHELGSVPGVRGLRGLFRTCQTAASTARIRTSTTGRRCRS